MEEQAQGKVRNGGRVAEENVVERDKEHLGGWAGKKQPPGAKGKQTLQVEPVTMFMKGRSISEEAGSIT